MLKLFVVIFVVTSGAFTCRWVCIDEYNNIDKRYYFNKNLFTFELPKREITLNNFDILPSVSKYKERTSRKLPIPVSGISLKMPEYDVSPKQVSCASQEVKKSIKINVKKIKCKPRETIVDIKYNGAKKIEPSKISTKLCTGVCSSNKTCISVKHVNKTMTISVIDHNNQARCSNVLVPEDTKCQCGCQMKQSDCLSTQVLDKKFCKCKCANVNGMKECQEKMQIHPNKYEWNTSKCTCQCTNESMCSTGTKWNHNECKCI